LQPHLVKLFLLLHSLHRKCETFQAVIIIEDIFEQLVSLDFTIIANGINQLHLLAELSQADDRWSDVLNFKRLEVKSQIQAHVSRLISQDADTNFFLDNLGSLVVQIEQLHAERTSTEAARPELYSEHICEYETGKAVLHYLSFWQQVESDHIGPVLKISVAVYDDVLV